MRLLSTKYSIPIGETHHLQPSDQCTLMTALVRERLSTRRRRCELWMLLSIVLQPGVRPIEFLPAFRYFTVDASAMSRFHVSSQVSFFIFPAKFLITVMAKNHVRLGTSELRQKSGWCIYGWGKIILRVILQRCPYRRYAQALFQFHYSIRFRGN